MSIRMHETAGMTYLQCVFGKMDLRTYVEKIGVWLKSRTNDVTFREELLTFMTALVIKHSYGCLL
jgi:hypothetical protein